MFSELSRLPFSLEATALASQVIPVLPQPDQTRSPKNRQGPAKNAPLLGSRKDQAGPLRGPCNSLRGEA